MGAHAVVHEPLWIVSRRAGEIRFENTLAKSAGVRDVHGNLLETAINAARADVSSGRHEVILTAPYRGAVSALPQFSACKPPMGCKRRKQETCLIPFVSAIERHS